MKKPPGGRLWTKKRRPKSNGNWEIGYFSLWSLGPHDDRNSTTCDRRAIHPDRLGRPRKSRESNRKCGRNWPRNTPQKRLGKACLSHLRQVEPAWRGQRQLQKKKKRQLLYLPLTCVLLCPCYISPEPTSTISGRSPFPHWAY